MEIVAKWQRPVAMRADGSGYSLELNSIPDEAGIYVFGREWGGNCEPLYVGQSQNLRQRMKQHLDSRKLMDALQSFPNGQRFVMVCTIALKRGQKIERVLDVLERGLIDRAMTDGHELINVHGTKTPTHSVTFEGNRTSEKVAGRRMFVRVT